MKRYILCYLATHRLSILAVARGWPAQVGVTAAHARGSPDGV